MAKCLSIADFKSSNIVQGIFLKNVRQFSENKNHSETELEIRIREWLAISIIIHYH